MIYTSGDPAADSYVSLAEADAYFASRVGASAWDPLSPGDKEKALLHACREMESFNYKEPKRTVAQALSFPTWRDVSVPARVKWAQCEQALHVSQNASTGGRSKAQQLAAQGVTSFKIGDHSQTFAGGGASAASVLAPAAYQYLAPFIASTGRLLDNFEESANPAGAWPLGN